MTKRACDVLRFNEHICQYLRLTSSDLYDSLGAEPELKL